MEQPELEILLESNINMAKNALGAANKELELYWEDRIKKEFNVYSGVIVTFRKKTARVTRVERRKFYKKPRIYGNVEKKDGSFGVREQCLYDCWNVIPT